MDFLPFSKEEYGKRLEKITQRITEEGLEAIILTRAQNINWVAGYRAAVMNWTLPLLPLIITKEGEMRFITRVIESATADTQLAPNPRKYKDHEDPYAILAELVKECGVEAGAIGVEEAFMTVFQLHLMKKALPKAQFKNASWLVENIRITLTEQEVAYFRRAAEITNIGFQKGLDLIRAGMYPYEVIGEMQKAMYQAGQSDVEVPKMWIWSGPKGGYMHDTAVNRPINEGDLATIEVWGTDCHYLAGAQGTVFLGEKPGAEILDEHKLVCEMYLAAKGALKPGTISGDTYRAANKVYHSLKGEDYWRRVGANMGLTFGPVDMGMTGSHVIEPWTPFILQIVEVEPALVTCCSTLMVTESGCEELTPPLLELKCIY
jgi:Xaa-Pro aminopeptidase